VVRHRRAADARVALQRSLGNPSPARYGSPPIIRQDMAQDTPTNGSLRDWLIDRVIRSLIALALAMPWDRRLRFMGRVSRRMIGPLAGYRRRARANLALIRPDLSQAQRHRIADAVLDNLGRTLIENYAPAAFAARLAATAQLCGDGLPALRAAQTAGRPVIFVTGHFGNHEAPRHVLHTMGFVIGGIYREMNNPFFNDHYARTLENVSGPVFPRGRRGTMGFVRHLKSGGMATILFDLHDGRGVPLAFLGRPAMTSTSAAELALKFGALLMPYFGIRQRDGTSFAVELQAPIPHSDPVTMTRIMTDRLQAQIAAHPGQWFWVHRRWKTDRPAIA